MLWLLAISLAIDTSDVSFWVLVASAVIVVLAVAVRAGWAGASTSARTQVWTAFLWCVPVAPVLLTLTVLGVTYL